MAKGADTKAAILDAAEGLFAEAGYDAVSMRDITGAAGVRLALATYHFATKEKLFEEVIARRADALSARRLEALSALDGTPPAVEQILEAFLGPYLALMQDGGPGWHAYGRLIAQTAQTARWCGLIARHFDTTARQFVDAFARALPDMPRDQILRGMVFTVSTMVGVFAANHRLDTLSDGAQSGDDLDMSYRCMLSFLAGGFRNLNGTGSP